MSFLSKYYEIYSINTYALANKKFIDEQAEKFTSLSSLLKELKNNKGYHFRIHKKTQYIFFGDLDNYCQEIKTFVEILQKFLLKHYNLKFDETEFKYTQSNTNINSYHYSIPKWTASTEKLKEIHTNLLRLNEKKFIYIEKNGAQKRNIDTTIYSEHWFRCPNQKKGISEKDVSLHIIKKGKMSDFIITNIDNGININDCCFIDNIDDKKIKVKIIRKNEENKKNNEIDVNDADDKKTSECELVLSKTLGKPVTIKRLFDDCYKSTRFEEYDIWIKICMALKNTFPEDIAFELFNYASAKGKNYKGISDAEKKFKTFIKRKNGDRITSATIYYYAIEDNKPKFIEIMKENTFDLEQQDMCKYLKLLAGKKFFYVVQNDVYKLYCYNGKIWKNDEVLLKQFLSDELYEFLKTILSELYFEHIMFNKMKTQIKKLQTAAFKRDIVSSYKEVNARDDVKFDDKWYLFGFNNTVYDLNEEIFRDYVYDDYVSITTGYDWRDPSDEELDVVNTIIKQIMPVDEERRLYLQILCTALDGKCLEKFILFNGSGGNGKGLCDDLLLYALGNYGMIGNNNLLFETSKMGSNPEKANIHKKRLVVFREPPENKKFENSICKELTGGGTFSARGHHESKTQKELNLTLVVECNKRPLFSEEPTDADTRRIIDILFRSTFTDKKDLVDNKYIFLANSYYKTSEFKQKHKFALLKILFDEYKIYKKNNNALLLPKSLEDRTQLYLELSCNIIQWFVDTYELTENIDDICKVKDLYDKFTESIYFANLTRNNKRKYNKSYFTEYISTNPFFKKYYTLKTANTRNFISQWKLKKDD